MPTTQPQPQPLTPLALPEGLSPDALDTLSELANLLTRILKPGTNGSSSSSSSSSSQPPPPPSIKQSSTPAASGPESEFPRKEFTASTDALKHRFQRARALIRTLPDLDRSLADQEAEMRALEAKMARQREVLAKLREVGARFAAGDEEGERMET
ncbi:RNA polymerase II transcription mediator complex subunit 9-domain-containing protein [Camillea tinctor]|nr:RNA polymerase II transcription mediator complex subunit 9-domain-containing protein [Camillea tinctor]